MDDAQILADEAAAQAEARYEQMQKLMELFEEPIRQAEARAEATMRLEAWLATHPPLPRTGSQPAA